MNESRIISLLESIEGHLHDISTAFANPPIPQITFDGLELSRGLEPYTKELNNQIIKPEEARAWWRASTLPTACEATRDNSQEGL